ncbi:4a-hydroxytetrahydrobiopterin dehydratase [Candidatus Saccharibacteria bacterium]|nr:4a-hydroxytetrahydrobiopterin dehydratase [Candidatus Saccharibacteria bacterium]
MSQTPIRSKIGIITRVWNEENNKLVREFTFADFKSALKFVNKLGDIAENMNHHPDIELSWGKVRISLTTHSSNGITENDRKLANKIDEIIN